MALSICPRCGKPRVKGRPCPRCGAAARKPSRRTREQEAARKAANPWRREYSTAAYARARQAVLDATGGRCAVSGVRIADRVGGKWVMRGNGGVHHKVPLSAGGTNDPSNLIPLETGVHNAVDAERRRRDGR